MASFIINYETESKRYMPVVPYPIFNIIDLLLPSSPNAKRATFTFSIYIVSVSTVCPTLFYIQRTIKTRSSPSWNLPCSEFSQLYIIFSHNKYGFVFMSIPSFQSHLHLYNASFFIFLIRLFLPQWKTISYSFKNISGDEAT